MKNDRITEDEIESSRPTGARNSLLAVEELTWALVDDHISDDGRLHLEQLLNDDETAREVYIRCMYLHAELQDFFSRDPKNRTQSSAPAKSPVLGFLNAGNFPLDSGSLAENSY